MKWNFAAQPPFGRSPHGLLTKNHSTGVIFAFGNGSKLEFGAGDAFIGLMKLGKRSARA